MFVFTSYKRDYDMFNLTPQGSPFGTKLCPLVGSEILAPWIILKISHFVWSTGLSGLMNISLMEHDNGTPTI